MSNRSLAHRTLPRRVVLALAAVSALCLVLAPWYGGAVEQFGLSRNGVAAGEYWRLFSNHFVHVSWPHLGLNLTALALLYALFSAELRRPAWLWLGPLLLVLLSVALLTLAPPRLYIGLSGMLHAMYGACAFLALPRDRFLAGSVLALLAAKVTVEQIRGPAAEMVALVGGPIALEAHLYGLVLGVATGAIFVAWQRFRAPPPR